MARTIGLAPVQFVKISLSVCMRAHLSLCFNFISTGKCPKEGELVGLGRGAGREGTDVDVRSLSGHAKIPELGACGFFFGFEGRLPT